MAIKIQNVWSEEMIKEIFIRGEKFNETVQADRKNLFLFEIKKKIKRKIIH